VRTSSLLPTTTVIGGVEIRRVVDTTTNEISGSVQIVISLNDNLKDPSSEIIEILESKTNNTIGINNSKFNGEYTIKKMYSGVYYGGSHANNYTLQYRNGIVIIPLKVSEKNYLFDGFNHTEYVTNLPPLSPVSILISKSVNGVHVDVNDHDNNSDSDSGNNIDNSRINNGVDSSNSPSRNGNLSLSNNSSFSRSSSFNDDYSRSSSVDTRGR